MKNNYIYNILIFTVIIFFLGKEYAYASDASKEINEKLKNTSLSSNRNLPKTINNDLELEATKALNMEFRYIFRFTKLEHAGFNINGFKKAQTKALLSNVCGSKLLKKFLNDKVTISYLYKGKHGKEISTISISPSMCGL